MSDFSNNLDLESLLRGRAGPDLEQWEMFVDDLRQVASAQADVSVAESHITAAAEMARTAPARRPAVASTTPVLRRRTVFTGLITTIIGKVLVGSMAVAAATAGAAAAGVLPDPVQGFMDDHVIQQDFLQEHEQIQLLIRQEAQIQEQAGEVGELAVQTRERLHEQQGIEQGQQQQQQGTEQGQQQQQGTEQGQQQQQQGDGTCADSADPNCGEPIQQQQGNGTCADSSDDSYCGDPVQAQTQQGPGGETAPQQAGANTP